MAGITSRATLRNPVPRKQNDHRAIVDASLAPAPGQRNTEGEREAIKSGKSAKEIWPTSVRQRQYHPQSGCQALNDPVFSGLQPGPRPSPPEVHPVESGSRLFGGIIRIHLGSKKHAVYSQAHHSP